MPPGDAIVKFKAGITHFQPRRSRAGYPHPVIGKRSDSGNDSPRRWGWGIPLKENDPLPESPAIFADLAEVVNGKINLGKINPGAG
jgi:hypothetical protein